MHETCLIIIHDPGTFGLADECSTTELTLLISHRSLGTLNILIKVACEIPQLECTISLAYKGFLTHSNVQLKSISHCINSEIYLQTCGTSFPLHVIAQRYHPFASHLNTL